jgi:hypothetical protein
VDLEVLKKKLDTYRNKRGRIVNVPDELRMEVLLAWEHWKGPAADFYRALGGSYKGMGSMIGKAKRLRREGHFPLEEFKEIKIEQVAPIGDESGLCKIELNWEGKQVIRFALVDQLIDFLKKAQAA